jgi:(p)ppGpp synthase/HD superfamily hydrolase
MSVTPRPLLTNRFAEAVDFALVAHAAQVRKGTSIPYLSHVLAVASLVIEHNGTEDAAIAGVLHDVPEDAGGLAMLEQIRARFGKGVASIVDGCTDTFQDPKPKWRPRKEKYLAHLAAEKNVQTCLVSAADKLHNARAILHDLRGTKDRGGVWRRFSASADAIGWYYGSLQRILAVRLAEHDGKEIVMELELALDAIAALPDCEPFGTGLHAGRDGRPCPSTAD